MAHCGKHHREARCLCRLQATRQDETRYTRQQEEEKRFRFLTVKGNNRRITTRYVNGGRDLSVYIKILLRPFHFSKTRGILFWSFFFCNCKRERDMIRLLIFSNNFYLAPVCFLLSFLWSFVLSFVLFKCFVFVLSSVLCVVFLVCLLYCLCVVFVVVCLCKDKAKA